MKYFSNSNKDKTVSMQCIWATSLELTWGVLETRMIIEKMREWVYQRVKPEISRWIRLTQSRSSLETLRTPDDDIVVRTRRAASCEPPRERPNLQHFATPKQPPRSKELPTLSRGETAPGSLGRRRPRYFSPVLQRKGAFGEESDEEGEDCKGSVQSYEPGSEKEEGDSASGSDTYIDADEVEDLNRLQVRHSQSGEEDDEDEDEDSEDEDEDGEDEDSEDEDSEDEDSEDEDEDEEGYYIEEERYSSYRRKSEVIKSLSMGNRYKKNNLKEDQIPRPGLRRRSSRF